MQRRAAEESLTDHGKDNSNGRAHVGDAIRHKPGILGFLRQIGFMGATGWQNAEPAAVIPPRMPPAAELVADKGYDSKALRDWLAERGTTAVIPPRKNRKVQYHYDKTVYRQRNIIERMFCRLKDWRRIATRFDRNIKNFIAAIALAAAIIWWL